MDVDTVGKWFVLITILGPLGLLFATGSLYATWVILKDLLGK